MKKIALLHVFLLVALTGCYDIFHDKSENIVGNISLVNGNNENDLGYTLVYYNDTLNENIINDYVTDLMATTQFF